MAAADKRSSTSDWQKYQKMKLKIQITLQLTTGILELFVSIIVKLLCKPQSIFKKVLTQLFLTGSTPAENHTS